MAKTDEFTNTIENKFKRLLEQKDCDVNMVQAPYKAFKKHKNLKIYKPEVDIGIGPFSEGDEICNSKYDEMIFAFEDLISNWIKYFKDNGQLFVEKKEWLRPLTAPLDFRDFITANTCGNARCFIAIEVENVTDKKYVMGSIVNAGVLGRIGILVAKNDEVFRAAMRTRQYFDHLREVRGRGINMNNVIVLKKEQLAESMQQYG